MMDADDIGQASQNSCRKLVLHLDVNNTVFVGDSITKSVTPEGTLNEYLSEVAWGIVDEKGDWKSSGEISVKPPDCNSISYYKFARTKFGGRPRSDFKNHIRMFTENEPGRPFRKYFDQMIGALEFPGDIKGKNGIQMPSFRDKKGVPHHNIVPSFYMLLEHLCKSQRDFAIVYRTFGNDGQVVIQATMDFLAQRHAKLQNPQDTHESGDPVNSQRYKVHFTRGEISRSSCQIRMRCPEDHLELSNLWDIYKYFTDTKGIKLFVEDYEWWKSQNFNSLAAKPLLINPTDESVHHIMFDDNFRPWEPEDSIINLLLAEGGNFNSVDPARFEDVCVVKADLYQSICNRNYFIEKIQLCERNYSKFITERKN